MADPTLLIGSETLEALEAVEVEVRDVLDQLTDPAGDEPTVLMHRPSIEDYWEMSAQARPVVYLARPRHLLGQALPWPALVPGTERAWTPGDGTCPGCQAQDLDAFTYCLVCHRSGLDDLIRYLLSFEPRRVIPPARSVDSPAKPSRSSRRRLVVAQDRPGLRGGLGS